MRRKKWKFLIYIFLILLIGDYLRTELTSDVPTTQPKVTIKYNGKSVSNKMGEHNWLSPERNGNSYLAGSSYEVGKTVPTFTAKCGEQVNISFSYKPKEMKIFSVVSEKTTECIFAVINSGKKYSFDLPSEKGQYIFEIRGNWGDFYDTSNIFRVDVE